MTLLFAFGALMGFATAPTLAYYASTNPQILWQAGGATALFIAGFGAVGYVTRRDLSSLARIFFWALIALIGFGILLIFVQIPNGQLIYAILGLVIFAGLDGVRLPAATAYAGHQGRAAARRVDLPGRPQRVPSAPLDLREEQLTKNETAMSTTVTATEIRPFQIDDSRRAARRAAPAHRGDALAHQGARRGSVAGRAAGDDAGARPLLGDRLRLAHGRGEAERAAAVHDRDRRGGDPLHPRALGARGRACR